MGYYVSFTGTVSAINIMGATVHGFGLYVMSVYSLSQEDYNTWNNYSSNIDKRNFLKTKTPLGKCESMSWIITRAVFTPSTGRLFANFEFNKTYYLVELLETDYIHSSTKQRMGSFIMSSDQVNQSSGTSISISVGNKTWTEETEYTPEPIVVPTGTWRKLKDGDILKDNQIMKFIYPSSDIPISSNFFYSKELSGYIRGFLSNTTQNKGAYIRSYIGTSTGCLLACMNYDDPQTEFYFRWHNTMTVSELNTSHVLYDCLYICEEEPQGKPIYFNGTQLEHIYFNGTEVTDVYFNGTKLT